jgi:transposase
LPLRWHLVAASIGTVFRVVSRVSGFPLVEQLLHFLAQLPFFVAHPAVTHRLPFNFYSCRRLPALTTRASIPTPAMADADRSASPPTTTGRMSRNPKLSTHSWHLPDGTPDAQWNKDLHYEDMSKSRSTTWPLKTAPFQELTVAIHGKSVDRSRACVSLTADERAQLLRWARARRSAYRLVVRSRIVLMASEGRSLRTTAARLNVTRATVRLWCDRFCKYGLAALEREKPGRGRKPGMSPQIVVAVFRAMETPPRNAPTWTARGLAAAAGTSASTVCRIWKRYGVVARSPCGRFEGGTADGYEP